jgi:hypothetical protein
VKQSRARASAGARSPQDEMAHNDEKPAAAPPTPGLSPVKTVLGVVVLLGLNYVFTDLLDESVCCSRLPCLLVH